MTTTPETGPALPWALKAAALLWPTPLWAFDPAGEHARWEELCAQLPWLYGQDQDGLLRAASWAQGAEHGDLDAVAPSGPPVDFLLPMHPLGAGAQVDGRAVGRNEAEGAWRERIGALTALAAPTDAASYQRLWWAWAAPAPGPGLLDRVPGDRAPLDRRAADGLPDDLARGDFPALRRANLAAAIAPGLAEGGETTIELVVVQLGPVQSFIEAARRTHDLWTGSMIVAWLTLQAARAVADQLGPDALLSPDLRWHSLARALSPHAQPAGEGPESDRRLLLTAANSNKLLFLCPGDRVDSVATAALKAASEAWREIAELVLARINGLGASRTAGWDKGYAAQINDLLTLSVVSVPWTAEALDEPGWGAASALSDEAAPLPARFGALVARAFAASEAARAGAVPPAWPGDARAKCSVDGEREQMGPAEGTATFWKALREAKGTGSGAGTERELPMLQLGAAEGLSAVSLTRRFAPEAYFGDPEALLGLDWDKPTDRAALRFPSTRSIAAAPFRALALARAPGALRAWEGAVDRLTAAIGFEAPGNLIPALGAMDEAGCRQDGDWLYPERFAVAVIEKEYPTVAGDRALGALANRAYDELRALHKALGTSPDSQPTPYYAVLVMDVDSLGKALSGRHDAVFGRAGKSPRPLLPSRQAAISERLANLSVFVLPKVVHAHLGRVVYCGGDDLLALLPLHTALRCADALRAAVQSLDGLGPLLTVSVGVGIGHSITPMRAVIQAARDAEKRAKQPLGAKVEVHGDHLGVEVRLRSGRPFGLTLPWRPRAADGAVSLVQALVDARFGGSEGAPRLNALPKFEAELAAMLGPALDVGAPLWQQPASPQVLHRLGVHLGYLEQGGAHSAIFKQLLAMAPGGARATPAQLVALLRLARFLRRELPTDDLKPLLDVVLPAGSRQ